MQAGPDAPSRSSMWDQEIPTLATMPIMCAILTFLLAMACNGLLNWYSLNHEWKVEETDEEGKTEVNYFMNRERVRYYRDGDFEREENNAISTDNETGAFFVGSDPHGVVPMFRIVRLLSVGVVFASMATAVLTIFTQRGMIPYDTKQLTTICSLLVVGLSVASAGFFAMQTPSTLQKHLEEKADAYNMHSGTTFPRGFFGTISEDDVATYDPYNNISITEDRKLSYRPGPAWFLMLTAVPGLAFATYHFQSKSNAGEELSIASFVGQAREKSGKGAGKKDRGRYADKAPTKPGPGLSLGDLQKGSEPLSGPDPGARDGPPSRSTARGPASRTKPGPRGPPPKVKGGGKGMTPDQEKKFMEMVDQYRKFTGKDRLTTNELAKLRDMVMKK